MRSPTSTVEPWRWVTRWAVPAPRILCTLVHEMKRRSAEAPRPYYGLATLCVGVGQGEATIVEWVGDGD